MLVDLSFSCHTPCLFSSSLTSGQPSLVMIACGDHNCSDFVAETYSSQYAWARPFVITPSRLILDSAYEIYSNTYNNHQLKYSWVGLASFTNPISSTLNMSLIDKMLIDDSRLIDKDVDVLAFVDLSRQEQSLSMYIEDACPGMMPILANVLVSIGEDPEKIACMDLLYPAFQAFHGEFFVARPAMLRSYLDWLVPVNKLLENRTTQHLSGDENNTNTSCILSLTHLLASYYFNANMAHIVTYEQYKSRLEPDEESWSYDEYTKEFNAATMVDITLYVCAKSFSVITSKIAFSSNRCSHLQITGQSTDCICSFS